MRPPYHFKGKKNSPKIHNLLKLNEILEESKTENFLITKKNKHFTFQTGGFTVVFWPFLKVAPTLPINFFPITVT